MHPLLAELAWKFDQLRTCDQILEAISGLELNQQLGDTGSDAIRRVAAVL